jgi:predicted permease
VNSIGATLGRDLRYAARTLRRNPLFTIVALATLAIGIGASTAVFSVVNGVLLEPLPYPGADDLVSIWHEAPGAPGITEISGGLQPSPSMYFTYAEENRTFERLGLWNQTAVSVTGSGDPEQVDAIVVSDGVFETLRVAPLLGRALSQADQVPNGPGALVLTHAYWQRRFGGDESVIGRGLTINGRTIEIVGVMPAGFRVVDTDADLIMPARFDRAALSLPPFCCNIVARLKPGATIEQANADVARMLPIWMDSWAFFGVNARAVYQDTWRITPALRPLKDDVVGGIGNVLWIVMGTIAVVLLIACANVTNLLLVRSEGRRRELAVRAALGAGSWRIGRALLLESVVLGMFGGVLGLGLAYAALALLVALGPGSLPRLDEISLDSRAFAFAFVVSLLAGLGSGLIPAFRHAGKRVSTALHSGGRGMSLGRDRHRAQNVLVIAQVALALVLLVSSGLMIRTFQALRSVEPGFTNAQELQTMRITIPNLLEPDTERVVQMQQGIVDALAAIPGVESAAFISSMPMEDIGPDWDALLVEGEEGAADTVPLRTFKYMSPGLMASAGTAFVAGRDITWDDIYDNHRVAVISANLARELFEAPSAALGRRIASGRGGEWREIVGVVADVRDNGVDEPAPAIVYWPSMMTNFYSFAPVYLQRSLTIVVRSPLAGTLAFTEQIQRAVWSVNASLPVASVRTMQDVYDKSLARTSFTLVMLGIAGAVALLLGVVGLYGVLSYVVSQRRREIAIRLALGAQRRALRRSFVAYGVALAGVGVAIGLVAAAGVTRLMASVLFDVRPLDLPTYAAVAMLLTLAAALASYLPARKASAVDPAEALAAE